MIEMMGVFQGNLHTDGSYALTVALGQFERTEFPVLHPCFFWCEMRYSDELYIWARRERELALNLHRKSTLDLARLRAHTHRHTHGFGRHRPILFRCNTPGPFFIGISRRHKDGF